MSSNEKFMVGGIVYLNSGSPRFTVEEILPNTNLVRVVWLDDINKLQRDEFPVACLTVTETHNERNL